MNTINILGININAGKKNEIMGTVEKWLGESAPRRIVTPNPEIILAARKDEEYFYILNTADLSIPDGIGLKFAALAMGSRLLRCTGADLTIDLLTLAEKRKYKAAIFNWRQGLSSAEEIEKALSLRFPLLAFLVLDVDREWTMPYYNKINRFRPDIIFSALGAPWQDKFNFEIMKQPIGARIAIGVGGSFDFLTGKAVRAPKLMRRIGLEWVWRLLIQPKRLRRIWRATVVFTLAFIKWRFIQPFLYRPNVAVMLFKKMPDDWYFLAVERTDEPGHWQLPQGGRDGESPESAGLKELSEEINCHKFKPLKTYRDVYKYKFGLREGEPDYRAAASRRHTGYKGQKQSLLIAEFIGTDKDISVNYWDHTAWKWIKRTDLLKEIHPIRKEASAVFLKKFEELFKIKP